MKKKQAFVPQTAAPSVTTSASNPTQVMPVNAVQGGSPSGALKGGIAGGGASPGGSPSKAAKASAAQGGLSPGSWEELFAQLSVSERLELVKVVLSGIEKELGESERGPVRAMPGSKLPGPSKNKAIKPGGTVAASGAAAGPAGFESAKSFDDLPSPADLELEWNFEPYDPAPFTTGVDAPIHRQRLEDAVSHLKGLLKKYGYVRGLPATSELARRAQEEIAAEARRRSEAERKTPEWSSWVVKGDDPEEGD